MNFKGVDLGEAASSALLIITGMTMAALPLAMEVRSPAVAIGFGLTAVTVGVARLFQQAVKL